MSVTTHVLFAFDELASGEARRVEVDGHRVAVVRIDDDVYAIGDVCSHADVSLAEGEVEVGEVSIECWRHGARFDLRTGEPLCLPAVRPVATYGAEVVSGRVAVTITNPSEDDDV